MYRRLADNDTVVFGLSPDTEEAHRRFREREKLPFDLLSDPDLRVCRLYDVGVTNLLVLKVVRRVSYVIGKDGLIRKAVHHMNPARHAADALATVCEVPR